MEAGSGRPQGNPLNELSVIVDAGPQSSNDCGYCHGTGCSASYGMPVRTLTVYAYQDLIDQGWRRAGSYLYKPDLEKSCCKAYTIRLNVESFTLDKKQRRLMRRWRDFLAGNTPASAGLGGGSSHPGSEDEGPGSPGSGRGGGRGARGAGSSRAGVGEARHGLPSGAPKHGTAAAAAVAAVAAAMGKGSLAKGSALGSSRPSADGGGRDRNGGGGGGSGSGGGGGPMVVDSPPADAKSGREGKDEEEEARALAEAVLEAAVAEVVAAGELPPGQPLPPPAVRLCTAKQRQNLPADVRLTSSSPFQLAAAARQAADGEAAGPGPSSAAAAAAAAAAGLKPKRAQAPGGGAAMQAAAAALASALAQRINDALRRAAEAEALAGGDAGPPGAPAGGGGGSGGGVDGSAAAALWRLCRPEAVAAAGHINFRWEAQPPAGAGGARAGDAGGADGGIPRAASASAHSSAGLGRKGQKRKQAATGPGPSEGGVGPGLGPGPGRRRSEGADPAPSADGRKSPETTVSVAGTGAVGTAAAAALAEQLAVPTGRLEIRLVPSKFIKEEYDLYVRYQTSQHGDEPEELSPRSFTRFLVDSPMRHVSKEQDPGAPESGYGSFHQQYWLDGRLVAVGVVDVLPRCLSSVYLFWDPDLRGLELGRFTALQEIAWTLRAQSTAASLRSYYMGFYIHSCAKMRYKAEYRPSELLCPVKKVWVRITRELLSALDASPFLELSALPGAECRPNLAAPPQVQAQQQAGAQAHRGPAQAQAQAGVPQPGQPAAVVAPAGAGAGAGRGGGAGTADGAAAPAPEAEADVGGTLVRLPGVPGLAVNVLRLRDLKRLRLFPEDVMEAVEDALRPWLEVVGWAAPSLVYEL